MPEGKFSKAESASTLRRIHESIERNKNTVTLELTIDEAAALARHLDSQWTMAGHIHSTEAKLAHAIKNTTGAHVSTAQHDYAIRNT